MGQLGLLCHSPPQNRTWLNRNSHSLNLPVVNGVFDYLYRIKNDHPQRMKSICLTLTLSLVSLLSFSQESVPVTETKSKALSFYFGMASSKISNDNWTNDKSLEIHNPAGINTGLSYTKYFRNWIGITLGLEYTTYRTNYRCAQYNKGTDLQTDPNGQKYLIVTQADYTYNRSIGNIEIPLCVRLESSPINKTRFYGDLGLKLCSAISSSLVASGSITTMALYPDPNYSNAGYLVWNQTATNDQTSQVSSSNDYRCATQSFSFFAQGGVLIPIDNRIQFTATVFYTKALGDINDSEKGTDYVNYLNQSEAYKASTTSALGVRLGVMLLFKE